MSKSSKVGKRAASPQASEVVLETEWDEDPAPEQAAVPEVLDAAKVAVELMIAAATVGRTVAGPGSIVILQSPGDLWTLIVDDHWRRYMLPNPPSAVGVTWGKWRRFCRSDGPAELMRDSEWRGTKDDIRSASVNADDAASMRGLIAISTNPDSCLPPEILAGADARYDVELLSDADLEELAFRLCGDRCQLLKVGAALGITPSALRIAHRHGQSADAFISRLMKITSALNKRKSTGPVGKHDSDSGSRWNLDNLHGMAAATAWGRTLVSDLRAYAVGELEWSDVDKGALLSGPPGCGKTTFAAALATSAGVPLIASSYAKWGSIGPNSRNHDAVGNLRAAFASAKSAAPCVFFIDELDSLPARGDAGHNESWFTPITNALLAELDGLEARAGVVVVAATNFPQRIDLALRRAGRLDRLIELTLPDEQALAAILGEHLGTAADGIELPAIARKLLGQSGADVEKLVRGARRRARSAGRPITGGDLLNELGADRRVTAPKLLGRLAVHESGHAIAATLSRIGMLEYVTLSSTPGRGPHSHIVGASSEMMSGDMDSLIQGFLSGRAAEIVALGEASALSGGEVRSDLAQATVFAAVAELECGLGSSGLTWSDVDHGTVGGILRSDPRLAHHVERRLQRLQAAAVTQLTLYRAALLAVSAALLEQETLTGDEVASIVNQNPPARQEIDIPPCPLRIVGGSV
jgi:cell division protease FtsH